MVGRLIWSLAKRFVGGRDIEEVLKKSHELKKLGYKLIISSSDEHVAYDDLPSILRIKQDYINLIMHLEKGDKVAIKLSQFGLQKARSIFEKRAAIPQLLAVLDAARTKNIQVPFDAEYLTDREFYSDFLTSLWEAGYQNIERVVQAYGPERDWKRFIKKCAGAPMPVRVCMGAYKSDPAALSFKTDYKKIDYQFNYAVNEFLSSGIEVEIATGNENRINFWEGRVGDSLTVHFAMLLGVRPDLASRLRRSGHAPYIYILFGNSWLPYIFRRLRENPGYLLMPFGKQENY